MGPNFSKLNRISLKCAGNNQREFLITQAEVVADCFAVQSDWVEYSIQSLGSCNDCYSSSGVDSEQGSDGKNILQPTELREYTTSNAPGKLGETVHSLIQKPSQVDESLFPVVNYAI